MSVKRKEKEVVLAEITPKTEPVEKGEETKLKIKDKFFDKEKTFLDKKTKNVSTIDADWRNLHIGGKAHVFKKGVAISKLQLQYFDKDAQAYWLESVK